MSTVDTEGRAAVSGRAGAVRFLVFSAIGAVMFFVPVPLGGQTTIPLDHIVSFLTEHFGGAVRYYALLVVAVGTVYPFATGHWRRGRVEVAFALLNVVGLAAGVLLVLGRGPGWLLDPDVGPFLYEKVVMQVGLIVPIGSVFLALLTGYGLMEFFGILLRRVMRPVWHTPGRSAIDAIASFVGSYSLGLLITGQMYRAGRYTTRDAAIIATGFSTVSATFMIVVANTLDLMSIWNAYFWTTLVVTFLVTAVTVRVWPLRSMPSSYHPDATPEPEDTTTGRPVRRAWSEAIRIASASAPLHRSVPATLRTGARMAMTILPSILSIGLIALVLALYTPVFDIAGYVFYPFVWALRLPDPGAVSTGAATGLAEMFLPAVIVAGSPPVSKFVIGVVAVSQIIFFSAVVPCIRAAGVPLPLWKMVVIWFERVLLTLVLTTPVAFLVT